MPLIIDAKEGWDVVVVEDVEAKMKYNVIGKLTWDTVQIIFIVNEKYKPFVSK